MTSEKLLGLEQLNELKFTDGEHARVISIFEDMYKEEEKMAQTDTENVEIMVHLRPRFNVLREDKRQQPFSRESLLDGAPEHTEDSWQVPRLVK